MYSQYSKLIYIASVLASTHLTSASSILHPRLNTKFCDVNPSPSFGNIANCDQPLRTSPLNKPDPWGVQCHPNIPGLDSFKFSDCGSTIDDLALAIADSLYEGKEVFDQWIWKDNLGAGKCAVGYYRPSSQGPVQSQQDPQALEAKLINNAMDIYVDMMHACAVDGVLTTIPSVNLPILPDSTGTGHTVEGAEDLSSFVIARKRLS